MSKTRSSAHARTVARRRWLVTSAVAGAGMIFGVSALYAFGRPGAPLPLWSVTSRAEVMTSPTPSSASVDGARAAALDRAAPTFSAAPPRPAAGASEAAGAGADAGVPAVSRDAVNALDAGDGVRWFNGRPIRPARTLRMRVTAYSPDERSCGRHADGITASGYSVWTNGTKLVAADTRLLPFGTLISVPGYAGGDPVPVLDRGGKIKGHRLDVLYATHERAVQWGVQTLEVTVWEYADGKPDDFRTNH